MIRKNLTFAAVFSILWLAPASSCYAELRAGAVAVDVTPREFPVIRNGGFLQATDDKVMDPLHARCIVLDDGSGKVAIVVVDSCMIPLSLCDEAKSLASDATDIPPDHMMISATHTHAAPSVMRYCLGSGIDERYRKFLTGKIAEAIKLANSRLEPAKIGWTRIDAAHFTKCRRWITRTDTLKEDPFGRLSIHATMHPGHLNPNFTGPSGPIDPWLSLLMVADANDQPLAALGNFSMHYFTGHPGVSADYYGRFASAIAKRLAADNPEFVGIMSQGTSGDLWWGDYANSKDKAPFENIGQFTTELTDLAMKAIEKVEYHGDNIPIRIAEKRLTLRRRVPDKERLDWARRLNKLRGDRIPKDRPEVYAQQAIYLHENPTDEVVLQAIRIGDLGITGMPNEVYGLTGLKLKRRSPLGTTFNMGLANGACGYIPPPEQHSLGGYTTWPARTAGLEEAAEPKIVNAVIGLLETVADRPRKTYRESATRFSKHIVSSKTYPPYAYWRLAEMEQTDAIDASGNDRPLRSVGPVAYHLPGRIGGGFGVKHDSHAIQLAGGKLVADNLDLGESCTLQFSFYLGTPADFRETTGVLVSRGDDQLSITGRESDSPGRLAFASAAGKQNEDQVGTTVIEPRRWYQVTFVRNGDFVQLFLDGNSTPELSAKVGRGKLNRTVMFGGNRQNTANFEGKLDEISVYDRALTEAERTAMAAAAGFDVKQPADAELRSEPRDVQSSMKQIHVRDGFRVELVAAEPLVIDPVAIDWGADGKLWVAEMADYPMGMDGKGKPGGRIRFLEDTDNDGRYDRSTLFAENVGFPNGVMAWRDGVLVTAAPEIFYAEDTDGDGKADKRETLFSGFMTGNQQLRVNGLRWGLDGYVHCASGAHHVNHGSGNSIFSAKQNAPVVLGSRDFRFRPDTGELDPQSGPSQFGRVRDDFGNWFGVQNSQPLWHYVLANQYTRRNTQVPSIDSRRQVRVPRMPEVYSAKPPQRRFHGFDHAGHYTSACGISIYRDEMLFPRDELHAFTCEPFHNLVQHHVLKHDGASFSGERADDGPIDFFASSDRWTRPVMSRTGPDGALWVVDMYRYMIEHPQWLPQEGQDALRPGYRAGDDLGRIYRIVADERSRRPVPKMNSGKAKELVALLEHPNGIVRDVVHRELLARTLTDQQLAQVRGIAEAGELAESRVQALAVLNGLDVIDPIIINIATKDTSPSVRKTAIQLAERFTNDELFQCGVLSLVNDTDPKVRLQLASSLGEWEGEKAAVALTQLARREDNDTYAIAAIVSSLPSHREFVSRSLLTDITTLPTSILDAVLAMSEPHPVELARILGRLMSDSSDLTEGVRFHAVARWLDSLEDRNETFQSLAKKHEELESLTGKFAAFADRARTNSRITVAVPDESYRVAAIRLLGREPEEQLDDISELTNLLSLKYSTSVRNAAMQRLVGIPRIEAAKVLIDRWQQFVPEQQSQASAALLARPDWTLQLVGALARGDIRVVDLTLSQQQSLRNSNNKQIATRAAAVLGAPADSERSKVVAEYFDELVAGDASRGELVFDKNCKVCHAIDKTQKLVGPDLRALTHRSRRGLLNSILDPSQTVEPKYLNYSVILLDGKILSGVIVSEDESSLTLVDATGKEHALPRSHVDQVERSANSIMPEGFETKIRPGEMSDLLAFLREL